MSNANINNSMGEEEEERCVDSVPPPKQTNDNDWSMFVSERVMLFTFIFVLYAAWNLSLKVAGATDVLMNPMLVYLLIECCAYSFEMMLLFVEVSPRLVHQARILSLFVLLLISLILVVHVILHWTEPVCVAFVMVFGLLILDCLATWFYRHF